VTFYYFRCQAVHNNSLLVLRLNFSDSWICLHAVVKNSYVWQMTVFFQRRLWLFLSIFRLVFGRQQRTLINTCSIVKLNIYVEKKSDRKGSKPLHKSTSGKGKPNRVTIHSLDANWNSYSTNILAFICQMWICNASFSGGSYVLFNVKSKGVPVNQC